MYYVFHLWTVDFGMPTFRLTCRTDCPSSSRAETLPFKKAVTRLAIFESAITKRNDSSADSSVFQSRHFLTKRSSEEIWISSLIATHTIAVSLPPTSLVNDSDLLLKAMKGRMHFWGHPSRKQNRRMKSIWRFLNFWTTDFHNRCIIWKLRMLSCDDDKIVIMLQRFWYEKRWFLKVIKKASLWLLLKPFNGYERVTPHLKGQNVSFRMMYNSCLLWLTKWS